MHIMLDLETLGTRPGSVFFSIGACVFGDGQIHREFYRLISPDDAVRAGLTIDPDTVVWWMKQDDTARSQLVKAFGEGAPLRDALEQFNRWVMDTALSRPTARPVRMWGCGSDFDNALLAEGYARVGMQPPWKFWNSRCYRTIKNMRPEIEMARTGTHHNALDDAVSQAIHLMQIVPGFGDNSF